MTSEQIIQAQLDAYNAQDVDAFCALYADDAVLALLNGDVLAHGLGAIRTRHETLFAANPQNRARLLKRIAVGATVVDHEDVERAPGGERFQVAAIYTMRDGKIARVDFARGAGAGDHASLVAAQVDAYNAGDAAKMSNFYAEDCVFSDLNGAVRQQGREAIRARYADVFAQHPQNRAWIESRIAVGDYVIDHEEGERAPGVDPFKVVAIYTIKSGLIARCDFAK